MEVYLNIAETGIGTYGVNAGSQRYFGHDASAMSATEAARIAAILPLPKKRGAVAPKGFTRRYGNTIAARIGVVGRDGLDACVYKGATAPVNKAPPPVTKAPRPLPGEEYETATPPRRRSRMRSRSFRPRSSEPRRRRAGPEHQPSRRRPQNSRKSRRTASNSAANGGVRSRNAAPPLTVEAANPAKEDINGHAYPKPSSRTAAHSKPLRAAATQSQRLFVGREQRADHRRRHLPAPRIGFAANYGRKALMQGMESMAGDWDEILAAEHDMALAIFDKMLATDETQTLQAQDAADEADPRARQACPPGRNGRLSGASRSQ